MMLGDMKATVKAMLGMGLVMTIVGTALLIDFSYSSTFDLFFSAQTNKRSERFLSCFFLFVWLAGVLATIFKRPSTVAVTVGLMASIVTVGYTFEELDLVRLLLDNYPSGSEVGDDLRKLAAGGVTAYIGAGLSFLAPAVQHGNFRASEGKLRIVTLVCTALCILGAALVLSSDSVAYTPGFPVSFTRVAMFQVTDIVIFVTFVFNVGVWSGLPVYMWLSSAFGAAYGLPVLSYYFDVEPQLNAFSDKDQVTAGIAILWVTVLVLIFASNVNMIDRSAYVAI